MILHRLFRRSHLFALIAIASTSASNATAALIPGTSQLGGWVYVDRNNDGHLAFSNEPNPEFAIPNVTVSLFSLVNNVENLVATLQTNAHGRYLFENIAPGTYVLRETQPVDFVDGKDTLGILQSLNGQPIPPNASAGTAGNNFFTNIVLTPDVGGEFYTFGELGLTAAATSKRDLLTSSPPPPLAGVPEPATLAILLAAGCCFFVTRRKSR